LTSPSLGMMRAPTRACDHSSHISAQWKIFHFRAIFRL
jgi:hypothetical protein